MPIPYLLPILAIFAALGMWTVGWMFDSAAIFALSVVLSAPLLGMLVRFWLPKLVGQSLRAAKELAYRDIEGRHFEYKGRAMLVREDLAGDRWLRTRDIHKIVPGFPRDAVLQRLYPQALGQAEARHGLFLQAQALDSHLQRSQDDATIRFRHWLQREVIFPAQRASQKNRIQT